MALLLLVLGPAGYLLARAALRRDTAALAGLALLGWVVFSGVWSDTPVETLVGSYGTDRSALVLAGFISAWSIGRGLTGCGRALLVHVLLAASALSATVAILQMLVDLGSAVPRGFEDRAQGLTDNPVFLGALMAGAIALASRQVREVTRWWLVLPLLTLYACALGLSGSRIALISAVVVMPFALLRAPWKRVALVMAALLLGLGLSFAVGASSSTERLAEGITAGTESTESGIVPRVEAWKAAGEALVERPILGYGPGRFRAATGPRLSSEFARTSTPEFQFFDAHNVIVEYATTLGAVGLALVGTFAFFAGRRARGGLALLAAAVAITWLLEPVSLNTAPVALLALGAAGPPFPEHAPLKTWGKLAVGALTAIGVVAGSAVLWGEVQVDRGRSDASIEALQRAENVFPRSAVLADIQTQLLLQRAQIVPSQRALDDTLAAARHTVDLEPDRSLWWSRLGLLEAAWVSLEEGRASYERALELYPWSERALDGLRQVAEAQGDTATVDRMNEALCTIDSTLCTSGT
jgi:hypothetical protein